MANNRYGENDNEPGGKAELSNKVKGKSGPGASFKPFTNPDGGEDQETMDINKTGVAHPENSKKSLPKK